MDGSVQHAEGETISLMNWTCPYCGRALGSKPTRDREHVIGRQFVPDGTLRDQWNVVMWAHKACNREKGDLEDDISAITMHPDAWGRHAVEDPRIAATLVRKASEARSRRTKKLVVESSESFSYSGALMGQMKFTFDMTCPPQTDGERTLRLAWYHAQAFFYLITYRKPDRTGAMIPGVFVGAAEANRSDWGNVRMRAFAEVTKSWPHRIHALGADGFFKLMIRRAPGMKEMWAWAGRECF